MITERGLMAAVVAVSLGSAGCVNCSPVACQKLSIAAGPTCDTPQTGRQKVYVYLMDGLPVPFTRGLDGLRPELYARGYSKVASGTVLHSAWMAKEMKRTHADDPNARFVVVGYDHGAVSAARLASDVAGGGVPVDALVLLDPSGKTATASGVRTVVIRSGHKADQGAGAESVVLPATHFGLPSHEATVAKVCEILDESATRAWLEQPHPTEVVGWDYEHAPEPLAKPRDVVAPAEWGFLNERPWGGSTPLTPADGAEGKRRRPETH